MNTRSIIAFGFLLLLGMSWVGCSTRKNKPLNRFWHRLNTRYNGYFNGKEAMKEGVLDLRKSRTDNYAGILPVFDIGHSDGWSDINANAERAIEKSGKMIKKHSMLINGQQHNSWIDNCYLLMGKANFFKKEFFLAAGQFRYVAVESEDELTKEEAKIWLLRVYNQENEFAEASAAMRQVRKGMLTEELKADFHAAEAEYFILQNRYEEALDVLDLAIKAEKRKRVRARYTFIKGQLYDALERPEEAYRAFSDCLELRPEYAMEFQARIRMAKNAGNNNAADLRAMFKKMLRDDKNIEYRDQIYYALALLDLSENNKEDAIEHLQSSIKESTNNQVQKASSFLLLAELNLEAQAYAPAQAYYDSTASLISKDHPRYDEILRLRDNLTEVVNNIRTVTLQDSLLQLGSMSENDLAVWLDNYILDLREQDEEAKRLMEQQALQVGAGGGGAEGGQWYFVNAQAKSFGAQEFQKVWGNRPLEDNWRRSAALSNGFADGEDGQDGEAENPRYLPETYLAEIPTSDSARKASKNMIYDALFALGVVYKDKIEDLPRSNDAFLELERRTDTSKHFPLAFYYLYLNYTEQKDISQADHYRKIITEQYPNSEYARILNNPNYLNEKDQQADAAEPLYNRAYAAFVSENRAQAYNLAATGLRDYPKSTLKHRFQLLTALTKSFPDSLGQKGLIEALKAVVTDNPETESAETATRLLEKLGVEAPKPAGKDTAQTPIDSLTPKKEYPFKYTPEVEHMVVVIVQDPGFNPEGLKGVLSNFNEASYKSKRLSVSNTLLGKENQLLNIRRFTNATDAMNYIQALQKQKILEKGIEEGGPRPILVPASINNLGLLFRTRDIDGYVEWVQQNYK